MMNVVEKKEFYKQYIQVHEKRISKFVAAVITDVISDQFMMQRIMHRAFLEMEQVDSKSDILNWLYVLSSEEVINAYKKKDKDYSFDYDEIKNEIDMHDISDWLLCEIDMTIFARLDRLFFRNKVILLMRYMANLRKSDIAKLLSIESGKVDDAIYDSLIKLIYILDGDPADVVAMIELDEWTDFPEFSENDDEDNENLELSSEDKLLDDMLKFKIPQIYRENPHLHAIKYGQSTTLIGQREFKSYEKMLCERIKDSITGESPKYDFAEVDYSFLRGKAVKKRRIFNVSQVAAVVVVALVTGIVGGLVIYGEFADAVKKRFVGDKEGIELSENQEFEEANRKHVIYSMEEIDYIRSVCQDLVIPVYIPAQYTLDKLIVEKKSKVEYTANYHFTNQEDDIFIIIPTASEYNDADIVNAESVMELDDRTIYCQEGSVIGQSLVGVEYGGKFISISGNISLEEMIEIAKNLE